MNKLRFVYQFVKNHSNEGIVNQMLKSIIYAALIKTNDESPHFKGIMCFRGGVLRTDRLIRQQAFPAELSFTSISSYLVAPSPG